MIVFKHKYTGSQSKPQSAYQQWRMGRNHMLVINHPTAISQESQARMTRAIEQAMSDHRPKVLVLEQGMTISGVIHHA